MSNTKITMLKLKRILQLLSAGVSQREISNKVGISRSSITAYKERADSSGKSYQELLQMSDSDVVSVLQRKDYRPGKDARYDKLEPLLEEYSRDITQNRSTYECLWTEYLKLHPEGHGYTRFKAYIQDYGEIDFQFTHKYQLSVLKKEEITYTIKGDELVFSNVKPDIIALIPKEYQLQLTKCCLIEEDYEYLIPKVYNSSTLLYFLKGMIWGDSASFPRYLYPTFEYSFEIGFTSPEGSYAKFGGSKFIVHSENKMFIDRIVGKFNALQELPDYVKDIPQHFQNLFEL